MTERSAARRLAKAVVDDLKGRGHILLVKGGTEGLVRELEVLIGAGLTEILPLIEEQPFEVVGEVTSTFGSEDVDEQVETLVGQVTSRLMDSDHVEDVFAEDKVIARDVFRALRSGLQGGLLALSDEPEERAPISVRLETLGYVAATVSRRADDLTLRDALERAALATEGQLTSYDAEVRQAFFEVPGDDPDRRLDIEEAVEDELADLARAGLVELPKTERRIALPRKISAAERAALLPRMEAIASRTLLASGAVASCRVGLDAVVLVFTPLSEGDAAVLDGLTAAFAEQLTAILSEPPAATGAGPTATRAAAKKPPSKRPEEVEHPPATKRTPAKKVDEPEPRSRRPATKAEKPEPAVKAKKPSAKTPPRSTKSPPASEKPSKAAPKKSAPVRKAGAAKKAPPKSAPASRR